MKNTLCLLVLAIKLLLCDAWADDVQVAGPPHVIRANLGESGFFLNYVGPRQENGASLTITLDSDGPSAVFQNLTLTHPGGIVARSQMILGPRVRILQYENRADLPHDETEVRGGPEDLDAPGQPRRGHRNSMKWTLTRLDEAERQALAKTWLEHRAEEHRASHVVPIRPLGFMVSTVDCGDGLFLVTVSPDGGRGEQLTLAARGGEFLGSVFESDFSRRIRQVVDLDGDLLPDVVIQDDESGVRTWYGVVAERTRITRESNSGSHASDPKAP
jgi:hypothetical protein